MLLQDPRAGTPPCNVGMPCKEDIYPASTRSSTNKFARWRGLGLHLLSRQYHFYVLKWRGSGPYQTRYWKEVKIIWQPLRMWLHSELLSQRAPCPLGLGASALLALRCFYWFALVLDPTIESYS